MTKRKKEVIPDRHLGKAKRNAAGAVIKEKPHA